MAGAAPPKEDLMDVCAHPYMLLLFNFTCGPKSRPQTGSYGYWPVYAYGGTTSRVLLIMHMAGPPPSHALFSSSFFFCWSWPAYNI